MLFGFFIRDYLALWLVRISASFGADNHMLAQFFWPFCFVFWFIDRCNSTILSGDGLTVKLVEFGV